MKQVINALVLTAALLAAQPMDAFGTRSVTDKDNLMLLAEGLASGFVAATSATKFGFEGTELMIAQHDVFFKLAAVLGWAYATRKLAPHSHKCLNLKKPRRDDKVERSDKKVTAFLKGGLAAYVGLISGYKGCKDLWNMFVHYEPNIFMTHRVTHFGGALGLLYSAYKLLPYSYHKLKEAVA
jgi:hypothetical protein